MMKSHTCMIRNDLFETLGNARQFSSAWLSRKR